MSPPVRRTNGSDRTLSLLLLVCKPADSHTGSGILVEAFLIDAHFRKAWMPYFRWEGRPVVSTLIFLDSLGAHSLQADFLNMPILTGEELYEALAKQSTAGGSDGLAWNEILPLLVCCWCCSGTSSG